MKRGRREGEAGCGDGGAGEGGGGNGMQDKKRERVKKVGPEEREKGERSEREEDLWTECRWLQDLRGVLGRISGNLLGS